jgi:hypothetical protein
MFILSALFLLLRSLVLSRLTLAAENLALRQQLAVLNRTVKRLQLRERDRLFSRDAVATLGRLAGSLDHRQTQYGRQMA